MSIFRSKWLRKILPFLLPVLLSTGPLAAAEQHQEAEDGLILESAQFHDKVSSSVRQLQIKYGFDVVYVSVVPIVRQVPSGDYIAGTSFDPISPDLINYPDRGPPHLLSIL